MVNNEVAELKDSVFRGPYQGMPTAPIPPLAFLRYFDDDDDDHGCYYEVNLPLPLSWTEMIFVHSAKFRAIHIIDAQYW